MKIRARASRGDGEKMIKSRWRRIRFWTTYLFDNGERYARQAFWRRWWRQAWDWIFHTVWDRWFYPHLRPRTYAKSCYDFWVDLRIPPQLEAYIWGTKWEGFVGHIFEKDGPSYMCCFMGDTFEDCKTDILEFLGWVKEEAGTIEDGWGIAWIEGDPEELKSSYTR